MNYSNLKKTILRGIAGTSIFFGLCAHDNVNELFERAKEYRSELKTAFESYLAARQTNDAGTINLTKDTFMRISQDYIKSLEALKTMYEKDATTKFKINRDELSPQTDMRAKLIGNDALWPLFSIIGGLLLATTVGGIDIGTGKSPAPEGTSDYRFSRIATITGLISAAGGLIGCLLYASKNDAREMISKIDAAEHLAYKSAEISMQELVQRSNDQERRLNEKI